VRVGEPWQKPRGSEMNVRSRLGICVLGGGDRRKIVTKFEENFLRCVTEISLQTLSCKCLR
jgi:hypothetical protein